MKRKVLICGATGFIGRNFIEHICKNQNVEVHAQRYQHSAFDSGNDVIWHQADLRKQDDVDRVVKGMDIIIQAAAIPLPSKQTDPHTYAAITDNAIINSYLFRSACEHKVKHLVFFSCASMYHSSNHPLKEKDFDANAPFPPQEAGLCQTKVYLENLGAYFANASSTRFTMIRHAASYGPHDRFDIGPRHFCGSIIAKVMAAQDSIVISGTGEEERDLIYVDDLMHLVEACIEKQSAPFRIYNCGTGESISRLGLLHKILKQTNKNLTIEHDLSHATIQSRIALDSSLARQELGWKPAIDLDSGIRKTLAWCRENVRIKVAEHA